MQRQIRLVFFVVLISLIALTSSARTYGQNESLDNSKPSGKIVKSYSEKQDSNAQPIQRPEWVERALRLSVLHLERQQNALRDVESSLILQSAEQDDLGITHLKFKQIKNGIEVFGGGLTTHVDQQDKVRSLGRVFAEAETVETTPLINEAEAIERAKAALGYTGDFAKTPEARLVILPDWIIEQRRQNSKATLTYLVELLIEGGANTARHFYFVNAKNGDVVWHYDNLQRQYGVTIGTGYSFYSGTVNFYTYRPFTVYYLQDNYKCPGCLPYPGPNPSYTMDMRNQTNVNNGYFFIDQDNLWGNGQLEYYQKAGVDAHFGMSKTWDYFYNVHGRYGIDSNGYQLIMRVHYDVNYSNAFWDGRAAFFGDGDGTTAISLVSVDTVGHEITHGLTEKTAGLIYANESGGSNESFSDIFGTAVEFYTGINPDYTIGEDWITPYVPNDALRYMYNPPLDGASIDHYSQYVPGMDVHFSSGIQNKAFYLLASDFKAVTRNDAERIFYRALTVYLFPSATFHDVRVATLNAAADLYGAGSRQYIATASAWNAVGVF